MSAAPPELHGRHLLLYDGVCALCHGVVKLVLRRDRADVFRFACVQSDRAAALLGARGLSTVSLDTVYVIADFGEEQERVLARGRAALFVARRIGWPWRAAAVLGILPTPVLDLGYRLVARIRYRLFGRYDSCPLPAPELRRRSIDL